MPENQSREQLEIERMNAIRSIMVGNIWGLALALKRARCNKAFRRFRTALAESGAIDHDNQLWLDSFAANPEAGRYQLMRTALALVASDIGESTEIRRKLRQLTLEIRTNLYFCCWPRFDDIRPHELSSIEQLSEYICQRLT